MNKFRRKGEHELLEKTAKIYKSITRDSMDGFVIIDSKGHFLDVNASYSSLIGYSQSELLKMSLADVEVAKKGDGISKRIQNIIKTGGDRFLIQHKKKDGTIIDIDASANYANYLGGFIFIFIRDVSERNKAEGILAKNRDKSRKIIEKQLTESYKHLGLINRKISLLLELGKFPKAKGYKKELVDHILNLAMNISDAPTGYLYNNSKEKGKFNLLSCKGIEDSHKEKIKVITENTVGLLKYLIKEKGVISGDIKRYEAELLALDNNLEYFITLPLSKGASLGGFIFLGFDKSKTLDPQDMEFLDVFAIHASSALSNAGIIK